MKEYKRPYLFFRGVKCTNCENVGAFRLQKDGVCLHCVRCYHSGYLHDGGFVNISGFDLVSIQGEFVRKECVCGNEGFIARINRFDKVEGVCLSCSTKISFTETESKVLRRRILRHERREGGRLIFANNTR